MGIVPVVSRKTVMFTALAAAGTLFAGVDSGRAASVLNSCTTYCHGMPPRDAARKANPHFNSQSSAFLGNHRTHLPSAPTNVNCNICHVPVAATNFGHQNDVINMANSLKGYSSAAVRARYNKGVFFNQTSIPNLTNASCSNVNCHFERQTPLWSSAPFVAPTDCNACHGAPPSGTTTAPAGGLAGSHTRHDVYFPGTNNCQKCHPGSVTFSHATSAGRPLRVQGYLRDPLNALETGGTYSGTGVNYLPSKSATPGFGSCSVIYCHSSGQGSSGTGTVAYQSPVWGSGALSCGSCHQNMGPAVNAAATGNHAAHAQIAAFDCSVCHTAAYTSSTVPAAAGSTHVDKSINLGFTGSNATGTTYSKGVVFAPGSAYGTCSTSKCHGSGQVTWGGTLWSTTDQCGICHSSNAAGAVTSAAPFYSTSFPVKVTSNTDVKVGAHTSHLTSTDSMTTALNCTDCHGTVTLASPTHMSGATNFTWSSLATKNGTLTPTYTAATGTCANVYCHGASMPGGDTTGSNRTPVWNVPFLPATLSAAACATCHGFPPSSASGHPVVAIPAGFPATASIGTTCSCHSNINPAGNSYATMFVNKALHINGTLEIISGGACAACHGYPPATTGFAAGTLGNWSSARSEDYVGGGGAHTVNSHVSKLARPSDGFANCAKCHNSADHVMTPIVFNPSQNVKIRVNQRYRYEAVKQFKYSSNRIDGASHVTGTCSNGSCHFGATPKWDPAH
jgi:predicted CxxxxCH...CXXCH cytochrome family protein